MSLVHADNFAIYGAEEAYLTNGVYAEAPNVALVDDPDINITAPCIRLRGFGANESLIRYVFPGGATDRVGLATRLWLDNLPVSDDEIPVPFCWRDGSNTILGCLVVTTTGILAYREFPTFADVVATPIPVITANGWYHIEAWLDFDGVGGGTLSVQVEGVPVIDAEPVTLANTNNCAQVSWQSSVGTNFHTAPYQYHKDLVVCDGLGTYNNDFIGGCIVYDLPPTADILVNWTLNGGALTGFSILDNAPPDPAVYLSAGTPPPGLYVCEADDLPADVTSVKGIITWVRAAKSDGGDGQLQVGVISDPTGTADVALGSDRPITTSQTYWRDVFEEDPKTTAPWTPISVNGINLQLDRTA